MGSAESASGSDLLEMLSAGTRRLRHFADKVDALNVFPIPDGDTGNNMLASMRAALDEARRASDTSASGVAQAFARGALVGARGNSGIILSQFWRGLAQGVDGKERISASDFAVSMQKAAMLAFEALSKPVEGTILTVIKDIASASRHESVGGEDLVSFMERVVHAARESVARTPQQLLMLREAGVVDAGGWGLQIILEGALDYLRDYQGDFQQQYQSPSAGIRTENLSSNTTRLPVSYGYCTEFLLRGNDLEPGRIRAALEDRGESLVVAGNERMIRVHLHTKEPDAVVDYARSLGRVDRLVIRDMDVQHQAFVRARGGGTFEAPSESAVAVIALVPTEGLAEVFRSLGAISVVVDGRDPGKRIEDLRAGIEAEGHRSALILPNSRDLLSAAKDLSKSVPHEVGIIPTVTIPQGISAVLAFNPMENSRTNSELMTEASEQVRSIEICRTLPHGDTDGSSSKDARFFALLDGELTASGDDPWPVLKEVIGRLNTEETELITIYYSDSSAGDVLEEVQSNLSRTYPHLEVETVPAGRLNSEFIVSLE
jgi:DAK2 domain fusion protein YloV